MSVERLVAAEVVLLREPGIQSALVLGEGTEVALAGYAGFAAPPPIVVRNLLSADEALSSQETVRLSNPEVLEELIGRSETRSALVRAVSQSVELEGDRIGPYVEPVTEVEIRLASHLSSVLGAGRVGLQDDLLDLGADSLHLLEIMEGFGAVLQREIGVLDLLEGGTIRGILGRLES